MIDRQIDAWGRVTLHGDAAVELLMQGRDITTLLLEPSDEIGQYNDACRQHDKIDYLIPPITQPEQPPEADLARRLATWAIPADYQDIAVRDRLLSLCQRPDEVARVNQEMDLYEAHRLVPVLRLMFFLVDHFRQRGIVWGVGRGSSVASYCLFKIGVHKIDCLRYGLDIREFLKDDAAKVPESAVINSLTLQEDSQWYDPCGDNL